MDDVKYDVVVTIAVTREGSRYPAKSVTLVAYGQDALTAADLEGQLSAGAVRTLGPYLP